MRSTVENLSADVSEAGLDPQEPSTSEEAATAQESRLERGAKLAIRVLPLVSGRVFGALLDRVTFARKQPGLGSAGVFAAGLACGGAIGALATPVSGPTLRKNLVQLLSAVTTEVLENAENAGGEGGGATLLRNIKHGIKHPRGSTA